MLQSKIDKLFCRYCKENGHELEECPKIKCRRCGCRGNIDKNCTVDVCDHCQKVGHTIDNCYRYNNICRFCKMSGHAINNCPSVVCRHCDDNHFSNQCPYMSSACKN